MTSSYAALWTLSMADWARRGSATWARNSLGSGFDSSVPAPLT